MQSEVFDFQQNYFKLLGLPECYRQDSARLDSQFRALQSQVHPDKFAHLPEAERRKSMQWSTQVNEAYQTLRSPIARARYLLALRGMDTQEETNTAMPADFLMQQMEWREAVEEARQAGDAGELDRLEARLRNEVRAMHELLAVKIDDEHEYAVAAEGVRKLKFLEKLAEEIASAFDAMDA